MAQNRNYLRTKYYCQVNNSKTMDVVMELSTENRDTTRKLSLRYVLLIDVSGSMDRIIGRQTFLEQVQEFATDVIEKLKESDCLSIVTFSHKHYIKLEMTEMTIGNKEKAQKIIKELETVAGTNLERAIDGALDEIERPPKSPKSPSRDCILIFTDGQPSAGEKDAKKLVEKITRRQYQRKLCTLLAAFTIGGDRPNLLTKISNLLEKDSFCWFDKNEKLDEQTPLSSRKPISCRIISIQIESLGGSYFNSADMDLRPTTQSHFVNSLSKDKRKNITFSIVLPTVPREVVDGQNIAKISVEYQDADLESHVAEGAVKFSTKTLKDTLDSLGERHTESKNADKMKAMRETSAFSMANDHPDTSWKAAQEVVLKVAEQKFKLIHANDIGETARNSGGEHVFIDADEKLKKIFERTKELLVGKENHKRLKSLYNLYELKTNDQAGDNSKDCSNSTSDDQSSVRTESVTMSVITEEPSRTANNPPPGKEDDRGNQDFVDARQEMDRLFKRNEELLVAGGENNTSLIGLCEELKLMLDQANKELKNFSKLASTKSSLGMEIPPTSAIKEKKIEKEKQVLETAKVQQPQTVTDILTTSAAEEKKMEEGKQVLEAKDQHSGREIDVETEKQRVRSAIEIGDLAVMEQCVRGLRALDLVNCVIGEEFLNYVQKEIVQRRELNGIKEKLEEFIAIQEFSLIEDLLDVIQTLKDKSDLTFIEEDENTFKTASNIFRIHCAINDLLPQLSLPEFPSNYVNIKTAIVQTQDLKREAEAICGLFRQNAEILLKMACDKRDHLREKKARLHREMGNLKHTLALAANPTNYNCICQAIDRMKEAMPEMKEFGLYKDKYDTILQEATSNRNLLNKVKKKIMKDLQKLKPDLKVLMTPDNLTTLRGAVEKMKNLKQQSLGFDGVYTASDEKDLFEGSVNLKHLEASVAKMENARRQLEDAMRADDYKQLKRAVKKARRAPFIDKDDLKESRKLLSLLDPRKRCAALKNAIKKEAIEEIEKALLEMKQACVSNDDLVNQAKYLLERLKKREKIKRSLESAIKSRDIKTLKQALDKFKRNNFEDSEIPVSVKAKDILTQLEVEKMRVKLEAAIQSRDIDILKSAMKEIEDKKYIEHMGDEWEKAEKLRDHLGEIAELREEIINTPEGALSEIHRYTNPRTPIFEIMKALFTILGEPQDAIKEWIQIQVLMRKLDRNSVRKRVKRFNVKDLSLETAKVVDELLNNMNLNKVKFLSKVAGAYYAWAKLVVKEVEQLCEQSERNNPEVDKTGSEDTQ